jgi:tetratricopeptide (TPR) repeat protein
MKAASSFIGIIVLVLFLNRTTVAQQFEEQTVTEHVFIISNPDIGENQVVIRSDSGLVVLNTFWSEIPAKAFKTEIERMFKRDDFAFVVNTVDRLDMFGGNAAYPNTDIIGHSNLVDKYKGRENEVDAEINRLIEMWRWKEDVSRKRLETYEKGSKEALNEESWMNTCKRRADELEAGFSLVLPDIIYHDRKILDLGDLTLELIWFGKAGYNGMTVLKIPEEKVAIIPGFLLHGQHLAPHPHNTYAELDVPRWIDIFEELFKGAHRVEKVICSGNQVWTSDRAAAHLHYIRKLWNDVRKTDTAGKSLARIQEELSLDTEFAFVKQMPVYLNNGDDWVRPQHKAHINIFYLQGKDLATEFLRKEMKQSSMTDALRMLKQQLNAGSRIYYDENLLNAFGYELLRSGSVREAIGIFKFNVELYPESSNVYDSLGEAYMKNGETGPAIQNYTKSLEINPDNTNAREMLNSLQP